MFKKYTTLAIATLLLFVMVGCKNKQQKANEFVCSYNLSTSSLINDLISATSAELLENSDIKIVFETNLENNDINKNVFSQLLPKLMGNFLSKDRAISDLLDEGVKIHLLVESNDGMELTAFKIDKQNLNSFLSSSVDVEKNLEIGKKSNLSPELKEMLVILNQSLPIENKEEGTKVLKIDIENDNELVYYVEVQDSFAKLIKGEAVKSLMKESIMRSPNYKILASSVKRLGVSKITYRYQDGKGGKITEINIDSISI